jgi:transcriptional regulator with XRE-family HTH domain
MQIMRQSIAAPRKPSGRWSKVRELRGQPLLELAAFSDCFGFYRRRKSLTVDELSRLAEVPRDTIRRFEMGDFAVVSIADLSALATALGYRISIRMLPASNTGPTKESD